MAEMTWTLPHPPALTTHERMTQLCDFFPTLAGMPGTCPWDQHKFATWASGPAPSNAIRQAAAFVLSVWNGSCEVHREQPWFNQRPFRVGRFDAVLAFGLWDEHHKEAYLRWCNDPFWP